MERLTVSGTSEAKADVTISELIKRLTEYEDAEEQGLLIRLPCEVGDILFWPIQKYDEEKQSTTYVVKKLEVIGYGGNILNPVVITTQDDEMRAYKFAKSAFGQRIFLNREEAEVALERMRRYETD